MDFQINPLKADEFVHFFNLTDAELEMQKACRQVVSSKPGTPCRVSMEDAEVGDTVILLNYVHQPEDNPYSASHAIFIRENARQAVIAVNEVPEVIRSRLISLRFFDQDHLMIDAEVLSGDMVAQALSRVFDDEKVAYVHLHYAKPGCFAAAACRVA